jgi:choline dehydrogenase-like flavoprotein
MTSYDYLIIGSGPGGTTAAKIISEYTNSTIAVVEEGSRNSSKINMGSFEDLSKRYRYGGAEIVFGSPSTSIAEGRGLGGGSEVNSGIYHRIPNQKVENWSKNFNIENLSTESLQDDYSYIENWLKIDNSNQNSKGLSKVIKNCAIKKNLEFEECKTWNKNKSSNVKNSMSVAFYDTEPKNINLYLNTKVNKIFFNSKRLATEVECFDGKSKFNIKFKFLIIACGTFQTPLLLHRSGYKFSNNLSFGIHPHLKIGAYFKEKILGEEIVSSCQIKLPNFNASLGSSINTNSWKALFLLDSWNNYNAEFNFEKLGIFYSMIIPSGTGKLRFSKILNNYFLSFKYSEKDKKNLYDSSKLLVEMLLETEAEKIIFPNKNISTLFKSSNFQYQDFRKNFKHFSLHSVHTFSSMRIGNRNSECDSFGILNNSKNVLISDASIVPGPPGVNPQGAIMALTSRNIRKILN